MLEKPSGIAANPYKSAKWDELTEGRGFTQSDIPTLELLCQWHQIARQCMDDMTVGDGIQVAYTNDLDDIKALPQIATLKQASAEIRALNKQLGINDEPKQEQETKDTPIYAIQIKRAKRAANATRKA